MNVSKNTTRRRPLAALMSLCLFVQHGPESGSSLQSTPFLVGRAQKHANSFAFLPSVRLRYASDTNGAEHSRLSNSTATISESGKTGGIPTNVVDEVRRTTNEPPYRIATVDAVCKGKDYVKAAAGSLGDIMATGNKGEGALPLGNLSSSLAHRDSLVTSTTSSGTLASSFGIAHPLDRMALTANGNLQRLVSSYYDAPVEVLVDYCHPAEDPVDDLKTFSISLPNEMKEPRRWDRLVRLSVHNQTFCRAHSIITVYDPLCQKLVESGEVGLGQLFRHLDILPEFELHNAGPYPARSGGGFWREYTLKCAELSCDIHESFQAHMWDLHPLRGNGK